MYDLFWNVEQGNVLGVGPKVIVAKQTISFAAAGITAANTTIIFKVGDNSLQSYMPDRAINGISGFETNAGYYIVSKTDTFLPEVAPPLV